MAEEKTTDQPKTQAPPSSAPAELRKVEKEFDRRVKLTRARPVLQRAFWLGWTLLDVILVVVFVGVIATYLVSGSFTDRAQVAVLTQNIDSLHSVTVANAASSLQAGDVRVFSLGDDLYDILIELENPNDDWWAEISYSFEDDGESSDMFSGFLLPEEQKPLLALRQSFSSKPSDAELVVEDLVWHRVDHHEISDLEAWLEDHQGFTVEDAVYSTDIEIDETELARSSFTVTNTSAFGYWNAKFLVLLFGVSGKVIGVNQSTIAGFESNEERSVNVNWFGDAPSASTEVTVEVIADINFFDEDEYMDPPGEVDDDLRDDDQFDD